MPVHWDWRESDWDWNWEGDMHWPHWRWLHAWPWNSSHHHRQPYKCGWRHNNGHWPLERDVCTRDLLTATHRSEAPWCHRSCLADWVSMDTGTEADSRGKGTYQVTIDVHHFRYDELSLKVRNNDTLILHGKMKDARAEKSSTICIAREFTRKYRLPRNYDGTLATAALSTDGILSIWVPAPPPLDDVERVVDITQTGEYFGSASQTKDVKAIENGNSPSGQGET